MFKAFIPFELREINFLRTLKRRFVVLQAHEIESLAKENRSKSILLLTDYDALAKARAHRNSITEDKQAVVFDLENESHREKLEEMLQRASKYIIYTVSSEARQSNNRLGKVTEK